MKNEAAILDFRGQGDEVLLLKLEIQLRGRSTWISNREPGNDDFQFKQNVAWEII